MPGERRRLFYDVYEVDGKLYRLWVQPLKNGLPRMKKHWGWSSDGASAC